MNKLRVFQNVCKRRKPFGYGSLLLFFLLLPVIITGQLGNRKRTEEGAETLMIVEQLQEGHYTVINETALGREEIPLELYVADKLMRTMGEEYEEEALKAQAVLLRAGLISDEGMSITISDQEYGKEVMKKKYLMAVAQTRGIYPEYDGKPIYGAYFEVSDGQTRSASELLPSENYPYLVSVHCERDFLSPEYAKTISVGKKEFEVAFEQISKTVVEEENLKDIGENRKHESKEGMDIIRDSAGYVLFIRYLDAWAEGEALRYALNLPSASFEIEEDSDEILFRCKGAGHGLGLSQFGANEMALEGKDYIEILNYFFQGITLTKIE